MPCMLLSVLQILLFIISTITFLKLGAFATALVFRIAAKEHDHSVLSLITQKELLPAIYLLGLLLFLCFTLLLMSLGAPWLSVIVLLVAPLLIPPFSLKPLILALMLKPSINFILWFIVITALGCTLFDVTNGIQSIWANNYGDLAFHLGMITSFTWGNNFPPQYHIFPGELLSYPFLINLWSAAFWWLSSNFQSLKLIFVMQWIVVWVLLYQALDGQRMRLLPWAVLFGGGAFHYITYALKEAATTTVALHSGQLIDKGYPWTSFLSTIWITQRSSLLGMCFVVVVAKLFLRGLDFPTSSIERTKFISLSGFILSLSLLAHTHFFLATALTLGLVLLFEIGKAAYAQNRSALLSTLNDLLTFLVAAAPAAFFLPFIIGKRGIVSLMYGWKPWENSGSDLSIMSATFEMWLHNAPLFIASIILLLCIAQKRSFAAALAILFFAANMVKLSVWEWDQIKFFCALYLLTLALWSTQSSKSARRWQFALLLAMIPSVFECIQTLADYKKNEIYPKELVAAAYNVRLKTEANAIILAAPNHNSPVTLTGRKLFSGYDGTLYSHALNYQKRNELVSNLEQAIQCNQSNLITDLDKKYCPTYLLWTQHEITYWKRALPPMSGRLIRISDNLYRIKN